MTAACVEMAFMMLDVCIVDTLSPPCFADETKPLRTVVLGFGREASRFAASSRSTEASSSAAMSRTDRISICMFS